MCVHEAVLFSQNSFSWESDLTRKELSGVSLFGFVFVFAFCCFPEPRALITLEFFWE